MKSRLTRGIAVLLFALAPTSEATTLPEHLELEYTFNRNGHDIGAVTRELKRLPNGNYKHTLWMRATGLTSLVYRTEWREDGEFAVAGTEAQPLHFAETRSGDKRAYEHRVTFDRAQSRLLFGDGRTQPFSRQIYDQGSMIYALMLDPPVKPGERLIAVTDGKVVDTYKFLYQGSEKLETPLGTFETVVIRRAKPAQLDEENRCRMEKRVDADCLPDDFTFWLAPAKGYVPVKLERRRKDETMTMVLRVARGL